MEILVFASVVINTLLTAVSVTVAVRVAKKKDAVVPDIVWELRSKMHHVESDVDDIYDRLKRQSSRKGMQKLRDDRAANPYAKQPNETDGEWKARARKLRNNGVAPTLTEEV